MTTTRRARPIRPSRKNLLPKGLQLSHVMERLSPQKSSRMTKAEVTHPC